MAGRQWALASLTRLTLRWQWMGIKQPQTDKPNYKKQVIQSSCFRETEEVLFPNLLLVGTASGNRWPKVDPNAICLLRTYSHLASELGHFVQPTIS